MHFRPPTSNIRLITALVVIAALLLVSQHWGMMLSNSDDPWLIRANWDEVKAFASSQKRFWMLIINSITQWPYQLGGWHGANATKILINSFTLFTFALFLQRLVSLPYALMCVLSWLAFMDVTNGYYSPFHGYLLMFNLPMGLLFLSLWWYLKLTDSGEKGWRLAGPFTLFGFSLLAYEPMMFFSAAFPAIGLYRRQLTQPAEPINRWTRSWARANWPLPFVILVFCTLYFGYRSAQSSGTTIALLDWGSDPIAVVKTIWRFSIYGFRAEIAPLLNLTVEVSGLAVAYGLIVGAAAWLLLPATDRHREEQFIRSPWAIAALSYFVFSPNSLHALTEGYRQWAMDNPYYVGNYLSSFALSMLVANGLIALVGGHKSSHERLLTFAVVYLLANSAGSNMQKWTLFSTINQRDAKLWELAIGDLRASSPLMQAGAELKLCARHPPEKVSGDDRFWSYQLTKELGRSVIYESKKINSSRCDTTIDFNIYRR